jgi:hypothetical protein
MWAAGFGAEDQDVGWDSGQGTSHNHCFAICWKRTTHHATQDNLQCVLLHMSTPGTKEFHLAQEIFK